MLIEAQLASADRESGVAKSTREADIASAVEGVKELVRLGPLTRVQKLINNVRDKFAFVGHSEVLLC